MPNNSLSKTVVVGSIEDVSARKSITIAEALLDAELLVICDHSGSMDEDVQTVGKTKYKILREKLQHLQEQHPGRVLVASFDHSSEFNFNGIPSEPAGGTQMAQALDFCREAATLVQQVVLISDGQPFDEQETLATASKYPKAINAIFVGDEGDYGAKFMRKLSQAKQGGTFSTEKESMNLLENKLAGLLPSGS